MREHEEQEGHVEHEERRERQGLKYTGNDN